MNKLFRNFRQIQLNDGKTTKYLKYAIGEIVLVVIGILIALQINNWNENRKTRLDEIKLLTNIKKALESDLQNQFEFHFVTVRLAIEETNAIRSHMKSKLPYKDSLATDFLVLTSGGTQFWTPQLTAYKRLESKGIEIIKNDSLLEAILDIYNLDYPLIQNTFDNYFRNIYEYGRPIARKKFKSSGEMTLGLFPINYGLLLEDVEFFNTIDVLHTVAQVIEKRMLKAKANVEGVIQKIDFELQKSN
ncbi:MAG: DUF6090 family protein [Saprospiraceae bacterium]|jgi:hypothetical protein